MTDSLRLGVIGAGVMGSNHARVARQLSGAVLSVVVDPDIERARSVAAGSDAAALDSLDDAIADMDVAVVAVPTADHTSTAMRLLDEDIHVLIEKPIAPTVSEASKILDLAADRGVVVAAGHVERFNAAVRELPHLVSEPIHVAASRVSPYSPRISDGVVLDLMIHDLDIVASLLDDDVTYVGGTARHIHSDSEDHAIANVTFASGVTASFEASRLGQQKTRRIEITQPDSVIVADLLRQDVTVYRMTQHEYLDDDGMRYRQSSVVEIPFIDQRGEPLLRELQDFVDAARGLSAPTVPGNDGRRGLDLAIRVNEALRRT